MGKEKLSLKKRLKTMLAVDTRRMFVSPLFYILVGISFVVPILILVMTTMMDGMVTTNPQTGLAGEPMKGFDYVWQILGSVSGNSTQSPQGMSMDLVSMCNINMMFFMIAVFVCLFICEDFRSGYAKNLFTVRSNKIDYVMSKTIVGFICSACMFIAFFLGALIGGGVSGLPFMGTGFNVGNIILCLLSKIFLTLVFVAIFTLASVIAKQKTWLALILSLAISMLLFNIAPMVSPLNSGILNVIFSLIGGIIFAIGLGLISNVILKKTSLV